MAQKRHQREHTLLQLCARPDPTVDVLDRAVQLLSVDVDWTYFIQAGFDHQVIPLIDRLLQLVGDPPVPVDLLEALRYRVGQNHKRNQYLADQSLALRQRLTSARIEQLWQIQGPPLTAKVYSSLVLRQAGVLAFLVYPRDLGLAHEILISEGFHAQGTSPGESTAGPLTLSTSTYERLRDGVRVELHATRASRDARTRPQEGATWESAVWRYHDRSVPVLSTIDHLIALCLQGTSEQWRILGTVADIAHLVSCDAQLAVDAVLDRARSVECETATIRGLMLTGELVEGMKQSLMQSYGERADRIEQNARSVWSKLFQGRAATGHAATSQATAEAAKASAQQHWADRSETWQRWSNLTLLTTMDDSNALFDAAGVAERQRVLDLACGPGDTSLLLSQRVGPMGMVVGTDLVVGMVAAATRRARTWELTNVRWSAADMEDLPFVNQCFDAVVCRLGVMYCPSVERAIGEAHRVLKPGQQAAFLVCGPMENNHLLGVVHEVLWDLFDKRPDSAPEAFRFAARNSLAPLLEGAGFSNVVEQDRRSEQTLPAQTRLWLATAERAMGWQLDALPPLTRNELERRMEAALQPYLRDVNYRLATHSRIVFGTAG